jgi:hypothetical protein
LGQRVLKVFRASRALQVRSVRPALMVVMESMERLVSRGSPVAMALMV